MEAQKNILETPLIGSSKPKKNKLQQKIKHGTSQYASYKANRRRMAANSRKANRSKN